jgi:hypothetical protein
MSARPEGARNCTLRARSYRTHKPKPFHINFNEFSRAHSDTTVPLRPNSHRMYTSVSKAAVAASRTNPASRVAPRRVRVNQAHAMATHSTSYGAHDGFATGIQLDERRSRKHGVEKRIKSNQRDTFMAHHKMARRRASGVAHHCDGYRHRHVSRKRYKRRVVRPCEAVPALCKIVHECNRDAYAYHS